MRGAARDRHHDAGVTGEAGYRSAAGVHVRWSSLGVVLLLLLGPGAGQSQSSIPATRCPGRPSVEKQDRVGRRLAGGELGEKIPAGSSMVNGSRIVDRRRPKSTAR